MSFKNSSAKILHPNFHSVCTLIFKFSKGHITLVKAKLYVK